MELCRCLSDSVGLGASHVSVMLLKVGKGCELVVRPFQRERLRCWLVPLLFGMVVAISF